MQSIAKKHRFTDNENQKIFLIKDSHIIAAVVIESTKLKIRYMALQIHSTMKADDKNHKDLNELKLDNFSEFITNINDNYR